MCHPVDRLQPLLTYPKRAYLVVGSGLGAVGHSQFPRAVQLPDHAEGGAKAGAGQRTSVAVRQDHRAMTTISYPVIKLQKSLITKPSPPRCHLIDRLRMEILISSHFELKTDVQRPINLILSLSQIN